MLFNSLDFAVFFLAVYGLYLLLPHRGQNRLLLLGSYFFYGCWDYRFLTLILLSTTVDFIVAQKMDRTDSTRHRKALLLVSICTGLGILGFFKYFNFFVDNAEDLLRVFGLDPSNWRLNIVLPVGISFYTFQSMSYTIDVYRKHLKPTGNYLDYALYVSLFPQLVAGPIERATHLLPQVLQPRAVTWRGVQAGAWLFFWGLIKKVVIADNLAEIVDAVFGGQVDLNAGYVLVGVYAFAFQIFCDFSGYSDMARGLAKFMGFDLMVNFRNPYFAINPSDFWRRWHISLSTWLRDYLYIPLGGNRKGPRRTYINLMLTMLLGGLWHGAAWTFVAWGAFHGLLLAVHRFITGGRQTASTGRWSFLWRCVLMFHAACFSWLLFRAASMEQVYDMLAALAGNVGIDRQAAGWLLTIAALTIPLWLVQWMEEKTGDPEAPLRLSLIPRVALFSAGLLMLIALGNTGGQAFIYFQF